jgi:hypothetical protein
MAGIPVVGIILNWTASAIIAQFTGTGSFVGIANMAASLIFAVQILLWRYMKRIDTVYFGFNKKGTIQNRLTPTFIIKYKE